MLKGTWNEAILFKCHFFRSSNATNSNRCPMA